MTAGKSQADLPQVVWGFETALLFWRAVHLGRIPRPEQTTLSELPRDCLTQYRELARLNLEKVGVLFTCRGLVARYASQSITWGSRDSSYPSGRGTHGTSQPRQMPVPVGLGIYPGATQPMHVLTAEAKQRHAHRAIKVHLMQGKLPEGSLYRVTDQVLVVSPELAFVQCCAGQRDLPIIELALELCGTYGFATAELPCYFNLKPLTDHHKLDQCAQAYRGHWGASAARRALSCVVDGLRSPREAELYLLLTFERALGGFGLPRPSVNRVVPIKGTPAEPLTRVTYFEVDFIWEDKLVVLEYDGFGEHEMDAAKVAADKERRSVLAAMGYTVIVVTKRDFADEESLRVKMAQVWLAIGVDEPKYEPEEEKAHATLFKWLTNPRHDHLPLGNGYH